MPRFSNRVYKKRKNVGKRKLTLIPSCDTTIAETVRSSAKQHMAGNSPVTSSSKKLTGGSDRFREYVSDSDDINEVLNIGLLSSVLKESVLCKMCSSVGVGLGITKHFGLACEMKIICACCKYEVTFYNSHASLFGENGRSRVFDVNVRLVYGLRSIGKGSAAGKLFCGIMNLPSPPSKFGYYCELVGSSVEDVALKTMKEAVEESVEMNGGSRDLVVALDGSWQKRGHKSLNGVVTATCGDSAKVIDVAILSKHCRCKNKIKGEHSGTCDANFSGSSGAMEVEGVKQIFERSVPRYNVRYKYYLGDGDSKGFKTIEELKPYGNEFVVEKLECIGHVQKRMGARLRRLKQTLGSSKLSDGKTIGGRGRLTDEVIERLQRYYGYAIRQNTSNTSDMRKAVWALFLHTASSNEYPQHSLCPKDSWCKYNAKKDYDHKHGLPATVINAIKPIFHDLAQPELLHKCLHGKTQNPNESVNNLIWTVIPKRVFVSIKTLHFGIYDAIATYNQGNSVKCEVLKALGFPAGVNTVRALRNIDRERIRGAERRERHMEYDGTTVQKRRQKRKLLEDEEEDPDNPSYSAGMY